MALNTSRYLHQSCPSHRQKKVKSLSNFKPITFPTPAFQKNPSGKCPPCCCINLAAFNTKCSKFVDFSSTASEPSGFGASSKVKMLSLGIPRVPVESWKTWNLSMKLGLKKVGVFFLVTVVLKPWCRNLFFQDATWNYMKVMKEGPWPCCSVPLKQETTIVRDCTIRITGLQQSYATPSRALFKHAGRSVKTWILES